MSTIGVDNVQSVIMSLGEVTLEGLLGVPEESNSIVIFAHGAGSSRLSPRNNYVASVLLYMKGELQHCCLIYLWSKKMPSIK